ncbi:hypothetical protein SAMN05216196_102558 [Lutimaribacter pacificus]|uniref:Uncharacterized protein n=1 Tax=Lutimaribacter pacificus TaxID=391948 RepID=A0A1H0FC65_9RHOB|nr:hypothetical protein SAMN05216196_102558 [Lutimaribacter pacificus]SHK47375.1 hypothetical protein SAMN05444142_105272 [Lutimaribacter pacificus]
MRPEALIFDVDGALAVLDTVSHLGGLAGIARLAAHPHPA